MSIPSNPKRFSSPSHSYVSAHQQSLPHCGQKEKPNVYYDVVSAAAGGSHFFRFLTEDGNEAPPDLVNQVLPQIETQLNRFPPWKMVTVTLAAGGVIEDEDMDREVPDNLLKPITPDLNKGEYDNLIKDDKPAASSTMAQQKPKSSVMPQRQVHKPSQLIQYKCFQPELAVSQPPKLHGILQPKHRSPTSSVTNNEERCQRVLLNVQGSSHSISRLKVLEPEPGIRFLKKKHYTLLHRLVMKP